MDYLNDMALFVEVVKAKSFTQASHKLGMPKSTLSVRISRLEQQMGLQLLNRTTRKVEPTEAGALYFERANYIVQEAKTAHEQLAKLLHEPAGLLRLSAPVDFAYEFIAPLLPEFCAKYPHIQLSLDLSPRKVDLIGEPFDLAIRTGEQPDSGLVQRLLARFSGGLYASPNYLAKQGEPQTPAELSQHQCLRFQAGFSEEWRLFHNDMEQVVPISGQILANSVGMLCRLAEQGLGIVALPSRLVQQQLATGSLQRILPDWHSQSVPIYALTSSKLLPAKTQVFLDFLKEKMG